MTILATLNAWELGALVVLAVLLVGSLVWAAVDKFRERRSFDAHSTDALNLVGYSRDEQIADFPEAVERGLRRSS